MLDKPAEEDPMSHTADEVVARSKQVHTAKNPMSPRNDQGSVRSNQPRPKDDAEVALEQLQKVWADKFGGTSV